MHIALYQPDIPQNAGTIMRMCSCLSLKLDIIEPCGFKISDKAFKRAGMDYINESNLIRHNSYDDFLSYVKVRNMRIILITTKVDKPYYEFSFSNNDVLLFGRESAGVPENVFSDADECLTIPMKSGFRSLNVALSSAMLAGEALRQIRYEIH